MSQDTGLWSVRRPRETLGAIGINVGIPPPGSALKRSNSSTTSNNNGSSTNSHGRSISSHRQSLAMSRSTQLQFQRSSLGGNLADMGFSSAKRSSFQSKSAFGNGPQTPGITKASTDAERRSSVYRSRQSTAGGISIHQSLFQLSQPAGVLKDPRPLRDRSFQAKMGHELMEYMTQNNFEMQMGYSLSPNVMKSPMQKDFNYMFQWLYRRIEPNHKFTKNIDQEVPPILKQLGYPFERSITKSQLAAVGGQNWSTFLGLLYWMMQLAQMLDGYVSNRYSDACLEVGVDVSGDHIVFDFLSTAYRDWLAMDEDMGDDDAERVLAPHIDSMAKAFERSNAKYNTELKILEDENARLQRDIEGLEKSLPDPAVLDNHFKIMEEDKVKFEEYNTLALQRSEKYEKRSEALKDELNQLAEELEAAHDEWTALRKAVDAQGISIEDIDRMNSDRERLQKSIDSASKRLDDVKKKVAEKEAAASHELEKLERLVDDYNALAYKVALTPATAVNAKGQNYELRVNVNEDGDYSSANFNSSRGTSPSAARLLADATTGYQPGHLLNLDLRGGHIRSSFLSLRKQTSDRRAEAVDIMMSDRELLDNMQEAIETKRGQLEGLEHRVRAAEEEREKTKETTTTQKMASDAQIEKMDKELSEMRTDLEDSVQLLEQREENASIEYERLKFQANSLRDELHTDIDRMLNDVIKFKIHIQKNLDDYEDFVAEELAKELHVGGSRDDTRAMDLS